MKTYMNLNECSVYPHLKQAAQKPLGLNRAQIMDEDRLTQFHLSMQDLDISYATECLRADELTLLQHLVDEQQVIAQFERMANGTAMNFIEGFSTARPALHLWNRDFAPDPSDKAVSKAVVRRELERISSFLEGMELGKIVGSDGRSFRHLIQVGIGGSELGPKAICRALLPHSRSDRKVSFISNIDPDHLNATLSSISLPETLFAVVSKSGSTLETRENTIAIQKELEAAGLNPHTHMVSITTRGSALDDAVRFRERFFMLPDVGGRFSVSSSVGMLSLGFLCSMHVVKAFLEGAATLDAATCHTRISENPALLLAILSVWNRNFLAIPTHAILPYSHGLSEFVAHVQQVEMESNGKGINRYGKNLPYDSAPVLWGACGTNAQHSFFQQLHQGHLVASCTFMGCRRPQMEDQNKTWAPVHHGHLLANMIAQCVALAQGQSHKNPNKNFPGNRPSHIIVVDQLNPRTLGLLLALFENKTALEGFIWNINSFDQEGVQLGKSLAESLSQKQAFQPASTDPTVMTGQRLMAKLRL